MLYNFETKSDKKRLTISFLDQGDLIKKPIDLAQTLYYPELSKFFKITSKQSGVPLTIISLFQLPPAITGSIVQESEKNPSIVITNNKIKAFFYVLLEFKKIPELRIFSLWQFSTCPVYKDKQSWCNSNQLEFNNCCFRNYLMNSPNLNDLKELQAMLAEPDEFSNSLERFCKFSGFFVNIETIYSTRRLSPEDLNLITVHDEILNKVDNSKLLQSIIFSSSTRKTPFLYSDQLKRSEVFQSSPILEEISNSKKINYSPLVKYVLKTLKNDSFENLNCQDLLLSLSLENDSFQKFLTDCFFTIYRNFIFLTKNVNEIQIKILFCDFIFED